MMKRWKLWLAAAVAAGILTAGCSDTNKIGDPARQYSDGGTEAAGSLYDGESHQGSTVDRSQPQTADAGQPAGSVSPDKMGNPGQSGSTRDTGDSVEVGSLPESEGDGTGGCELVIASDIHYLSSELTDLQSGFSYMVEHGDGKVVNYVWQITDAFLEEVKSRRPDALILCGDLSLNGELLSHQELAGRLTELELAGVPVYVIPGNHDIQNTGAAAYREGVRFPAEYTSPGQFAEIYGGFGYDEAISRDTASLSYVCQLDEYNRVMMLDTCQYDPVNRVGGMVKTETYDWIEGQLEDAWDQGMNVIPVAHHNLLDQSEIYVDDCTIEHSEQLIGLLRDWDVPLFLSGHLHVQHYMHSDDDDYGIWEIVTGSLSTPPCKYGLLHYGDDGSFRYETKQVDMEGWARRRHLDSEDLLHFTQYGKSFLEKVFYNQAQDEFKRFDKAGSLTEKQKEEMAVFYARLNSAYYGGTAVEARHQSFVEKGYRLWEEWSYPSILTQYLEHIISSADRDYNQLQSD